MRDPGGGDREERRQRQHRHADRQLQHAEQPERVGGAVGDAAEDEAARGDPHQVHREHGRERVRGPREDEDDEARPDHLEAQAREARHREGHHGPAQGAFGIEGPRGGAGIGGCLHRRRLRHAAPEEEGGRPHREVEGRGRPGRPHHAEQRDGREARREATRRRAQGVERVQAARARAQVPEPLHGVLREQG